MVTIVENPTMRHLDDAKGHIYACPNKECNMVYTKYVDMNFANECHKCKTALPPVVKLCKSTRARLDYHLAPVKILHSVKQIPDLRGLIGVRRGDNHNYTELDDIIAGLGMEH